MRVMTAYYYPYYGDYPLPPLMYGYYDPYAANACHNAYMYDYTQPPYNYGYGYLYSYGETEDYNLELLLPVKRSFPTKEDLLYANELYDGTTRQRLDDNGQPYDFLYQKPFVEFYSAQKAGTQIKYEITGPLPTDNSVYLAKDPNTGSD